jgi:hypothetical protein
MPLFAIFFGLNWGLLVNFATLYEKNYSYLFGDIESVGLYFKISKNNEEQGYGLQSSNGRKISRNQEIQKCPTII